jgi:hypothetical protein
MLNYGGTKVYGQNDGVFFDLSKELTDIGG